MTWTQIGWVIIGVAALSLVGFSLVFKGRGGYQVRRLPAVKALLDQRVIALERGQERQVVLGDRLWNRAYPGLGLQALAVLPGLASSEHLFDGGQAVSGGAGELVLFARQVVRGEYADGYSTGLEMPGNPLQVPGPTPLSFLAGQMMEINLGAPGSVALLGHFGAGSPLWAEAAFIKGSHVFAAAGSISAQAALYLGTSDLVIGESVFMLPGLVEPSPTHQAGWLTEDLIRVGLMVLILVASVLKMAGVL